MKKNKKIFLLGLTSIFIGVFLLAPVFASESWGTENLQTKPVQISQIYKIHENQRIIHENSREVEGTKSIRTHQLNKWDNRPVYYYENPHQYYERAQVNKKNPSYTQYGNQETRKSFLGDYIKEYSVYITNRERTGRYFTVKFNFEDKNGYEFSQSVTQYLRTGEKKKFVYKDLQYERNEILNWDYNIIPQTR
jgi:hypothetical protein